jgi:hypothetical protein
MDNHKHNSTLSLILVVGVVSLLAGLVNCEDAMVGRVVEIEPAALEAVQSVYDRVAVLFVS